VRFAHPFDNREVLEGIRRLRANVVLTYVIAIAAVALATLLRFVVEGELPRALPFTTYSLALIVAAVFCGFWPALIALFIATISGWYFFLPPAFSFALEPGEIWALIMFAVVGLIDITLLSALIASVLARDQYQQFLRRELQHRSQNLFAVIQAISSRSLVEGKTLSEAREAFNARLAALARTHAMLENSAWAGAPLRQIVLQELLGFANQISITGCDIALNTPAAQDFALIVHELTTNAVKHGALSSSEGRVKIDGRVEGVNGKGEFRFVWQESGGPLVAPPTRKGFGTAILFGTAKHFGQNIESKYAPDGFSYNLVGALNQIEPPTNRVIPKQTKTFHFFPFRFEP
jgi:two-component sensor histidine kinase